MSPNEHTMRTRTMNRPMARGLRTAVALACAVWLGGCAVGPDYARPALAASEGFSPKPLPEVTASAPVAAGGAQRFVRTQDIQAEWWKLFQSKALDAVIEKAFAANPTVESAPARTKIAGNLGGNSPGVQGNGTVISTTANPSAQEGGTAPFNAPVIYNFHTAQLTVGYTPDVFGGNRRQVEALEAQATYQQLQLEATYLTLAANVAAAAIQEALLRQQIASTREIVELNTQSVALLNRQLKAGYASRLDLALQENALAQASQLLPPLEKQFEQNRNLLRALTGGVQDVELPQTFDLASLQLPESLPLSLPSQVVAQRPDVRAAEEQVHAASAQVGVAIAARLPQFSIDATWGGAASQFSQMFLNSGRFFSLTGNIAQPLFDAGVLKSRQRAAEEALKQAQAQYRATAITAFQNVADTLQAIHSDARALRAAVELERTSRTSMELIGRQLSKGYVDRLALLTAQQNHHQATMALAQAQAARLGDTAALFQALGGGWWNRVAQASPGE
jgi:NodT family efflux transporter outer membrane factor (OMF) lipoprotein